MLIKCAGVVVCMAATMLHLMPSDPEVAAMEVEAMALYSSFGVMGSKVSVMFTSGFLM